MSTERRQTIEDVEKEQRVLEDRRKLIDGVKDERNGYLYRNTQFFRYIMITSVIVIILAIVGDIIRWHVWYNFIWTFAPENPSAIYISHDIITNASIHSNTLGVTCFISGAIAFATGIMSTIAYFFTKNKNKIEFQAELEQNEKMLDLVKKYRAGDVPEETNERRKIIESVEKNQRKLADRRKSLNSATKARDGYLYRDTIIPHNTMVVSAVGVVISVAAYIMYLYVYNADYSGVSGYASETLSMMSTLGAATQFALAISATIAILSASAYFYLKERNKKEFSEELDLCEKNIRLIKNHREDDEATKEE